MKYTIDTVPSKKSLGKIPRNMLLAVSLLLITVSGISGAVYYAIRTGDQQEKAASESTDEQKNSEVESSEAEESPTREAAEINGTATEGAADRKLFPEYSGPPLLWGAYTGWTVSQVEEFRDQVGVSMDYLGVFVHWGNESEFPQEMAQYAEAHDMMLVIYWEAMDYDYPSPSDPRFSYDAIIRGDWDEYILDFADQVNAFGGPVIILPFEEMNSDWYPWSGVINDNDASKHVTAYRHIRDMFRYVGNVSFGWSVNNDSVPDTRENERLIYYPGDNYVDYIGVDGFNFGDPWQSASEVFDNAMADLSTLGKPILVFSMACSDGSQKAAWIQDALSVRLPSYENVKGWIWFNEDKERDWRVWSDSDSLDAFKAAVSQ